MRATTMALVAAGTMLATAAAAQDKKYGPGVTDTEITIGQSAPFSGPASAFGIYSRVEQAYFNAVNEKGGINKRRVKFIMLDNGFSPPKALEASRKLVEEDHVLAEVGTVGTPTNSATQRYLNGKKVPQLLISAGGSKFNDPKQYPWTVPFYPSFETEAVGFARYALKAQQAPKIAVLYQNDDYGKDFLKGLQKALGENYKKLVVSEQSYELTDPTVDSQVISLAGSATDSQRKTGNENRKGCYRIGGEHTARAAQPGERGTRRRPGRQARVFQPGPLGEGSHRRGDGRCRRASRAHRLGHCDRGADQRQHRHRARHGRRSAWIPADLDNARDHEPGAPHAAASLRGRARADPGARRHGRRDPQSGGDCGLGP
jgi:hypothetical protein